jgi:hypothetical protein
MKRDERLLLIAHGSASFGELVVGLGHLITSSEARSTYLRYASVSSVLRAAFGSEDHLYRILIKRRPHLVKWLGLALLFGVVFVEWVGYSTPALMDAIHALARRCGL